MRTQLSAAVATACAVGFLAPMPAVQAVLEKPPAPRTFEKTIKSGRAIVRKTLKETGATSISVALVSRGKVVWSQRFGTMGTSPEKPSAGTMYWQGSVSKMLTAIAVMQLVDAGKVSLDRPVVDYIPDFRMQSPQYRQITVRMLLNHSAGLPGSDYSNGISYEPIPTYAEGVLEALRSEPLKDTPGAVNVYCNDCFTLAGILVERVSGTRFPDYVQRNILQPLGMKHSRYAVTKPAEGSVAPVVSDGTQLPAEVMNIYASGGLMASENDMAKLTRVFTGNGTVDGRRILSEGAIEQMSRDQTTTTLRAGPPGDWRFGLGWDCVQDPALNKAGVTAWGKSGNVPSYNADMLVVPQADMAFVIAAAGTGFGGTRAQGIGQQVLVRALAENGLGRRLQPVSGQPGRDKATAKDVKRVRGTYLAYGGGTRIEAAADNSLVKSVLTDGAWQRSPGKYVLRKDGRFWSTKTRGESLAAVKAWGRRYLVTRRVSDSAYYYASLTSGMRTLAGPALSPAWQARMGQFYLVVDQDPSSTVWSAYGPPVMFFFGASGVSGYPFASSALIGTVPFAPDGDDEGGMFVTVPQVYGRDLQHFRITRSEGAEYVHGVGAVWRSLADVPVLEPGSTTVATGAEGYAQWRQVAQASRVAVSGQTAWKVYDSELVHLGAGGSEPGMVTVPAGGYLLLFGSPNAAVDLDVAAG